MKKITYILIILLISFLASIFILVNKTEDISNNTKINTDFITLKDVGQVALDNDKELKIQSFINKDILIDGSDLIINAGNEFIELRVGNSSKIRIERESIYITTDNLIINGEKY